MAADVATLNDFEGLVGGVLSTALPLLGLAAGIMVLVAGFQIIAAGGEREGMQKAKNTLTYAVLGLVLAFVSWFILRFVHFFTGVDVTQFKIGS